ncbi:MAG: DUF2007 domain-containing protein [Clostridia bacterium]|nr:DUF2007 domain-containing protein [Clostridia bacterium]
MYCPNCQIITDENVRCPVCGRKKVRDPLPEDICFLTEADSIPAKMLKDILEQNNIPVLSNSNIGAGMAMRAGSMFERIKCYVRYDNLQKAKEIVEGLFHSTEEAQSKYDD